MSDFFHKLSVRLALNEAVAIGDMKQVGELLSENRETVRVELEGAAAQGEKTVSGTTITQDTVTAFNTKFPKLGG